MLHFWQHWNWWYVGMIAGLVLAYVLGYASYGENPETVRTRKLRTGHQAIFIIAGAVLMTAWVLTESQAGIVHVLSGGKTAEQATRDGSGAVILVGAALGVLIVYGIALLAFFCL